MFRIDLFKDEFGKNVELNKYGLPKDGRMHNQIYVHRLHAKEFGHRFKNKDSKQVKDCVVTKSMLKYTIDAIDNAVVETSPFKHIKVDGVFREDLFACIRHHIPSYESTNMIYQDKLAYRDPGRNFKRIWPETESAAVSKFWYDFGRAFSSASFIDSLTHKFKDVLKDRYSNDELRTENLEFENQLVRDLLGYKIRPHTDKKTKLITTVFYIESEQRIGTGTSLYSNYSEETLHHRLDFVPNTLFAFAPCRSSFHGVETQRSTFPRDTIQGFVHCGLNCDVRDLGSC